MKKQSLMIAAVGALFSGAACADDAPTVNAYSTPDLSLDCDAGFEKLKTDALAIEGMEMVTENEGQIAYMSEGVSFTLTKDPHPAHPMIVRRDVIVEEETVDVRMAGCGYGSKEASDAVMERFELMNERYLLQSKVRVVE